MKKKSSTFRFGWMVGLIFACAVLMTACGAPSGGNQQAQGGTETSSGDAGSASQNEGTGTVHEVHLMIRPVEGNPIPEFYFEPSGLYVEPGDTVKFIADTPHHTVTAYHPLQGKPQRVPDGVEPFSSPVMPIGTSWEYTFDTPGVYDIWCAPHESYGMVMRIVAGEATGPATEAPTDFGPEGTFGVAGSVLLDPALDPQNIIQAGSVSWEDIDAKSKTAEGAGAH